MHALKGDDPVLVSNNHGTCMVTTPQHERMVPLYQVSYPGSGSEMSRDLIEAITGVKTTVTKRRSDVVAVKTYYPYRPFDLQPSLLNRDMNKMIFIICYPLHAIASNFNHLYWRDNNLPPSAQPPKEAWEEWRDENFESEFNSWQEQLSFWMSNFKGPNRIILSYESLIDEETGPKDAMRMSLFLRASYNEGTINPAPAFTLPCLWFQAVKVNDCSKTDMFQDTRYKSSGNDEPMYTTRHLEMAATKLNDLEMKFGTERHIGPILQNYWEHTVLQIK